MKDEVTHCVKNEPYLRSPVQSTCDGCDQIGDQYYENCSDGYYAAGDNCIFQCPHEFGLTDLGEHICAKERHVRGTEPNLDNLVYTEQQAQKQVLQLQELIYDEALKFL